MNDLAQQTNGRLVVESDVALFDTGQFEHMHRVAKLMSSSTLVPKHLQGKDANCMLIVQQALRWRMDPFALAVGTFVVQDRLGYEGKVVAAVVNTRAKLKQRLRYDLSGSGQECSVVVRGTFEGEDEERTVEATWAEGRKLSPAGAKWEELPDQQLCYYAVRKWARRHCPELILGVLSDDEVQAMSAHIGPENAILVGGHSEAPPANLDELMTQRAAEKQAAAGSAPDPEDMPTTEAQKEAAKFDHQQPGPQDAPKEEKKERAPRITLNFRGEGTTRTAFLKDAAHLLRSMQSPEDWEALQSEFLDACRTIENQEQQRQIWGEVTALLAKYEPQPAEGNLI